MTESAYRFRQQRDEAEKFRPALVTAFFTTDRAFFGMLEICRGRQITLKTEGQAKGSSSSLYDGTAPFTRLRLRGL